MSNASGNLRVSGNTDIVGNIDISGNINCHNTISFSKINLKTDLIKLNSGFYYNYQSGWIPVSINDTITLNHNLNCNMITYPLHLKVLFADSITPHVGPNIGPLGTAIVIDITGQNMNTAGGVGYSIRYVTFNSIEMKFGKDRICVVNEQEQFNEGYINIFMYK